MSMGAIGNVDEYKAVIELKDSILEKFGDENADDFILSMGTSQDYELAITHGSTQVRLGTTIFGARDYSNND